MSRSHKNVLFAVLVGLSLPAAAPAQDKLAFVIPFLYGTRGLFVDSQNPTIHSAHFDSAFQSTFALKFNVALGSQLASVPAPSPASGFTYEFSPTLGAFTRSTQTFGPIYADRAETIGRRKFSVGFNYQHFGFDTLEGMELSSVPAIFSHDDDPQNRAFEGDIVSASNDLDVRVDQFTAFFTYGVTDRVDVSFIVPVVTAELTVVSDTQIYRAPGSSAQVHFFAGSPDLSTRQYVRSESASGIGDVHIRAKGTLSKSERSGFAVGVDLRLPTGDEEDLLGTGALGLKPFFAFSRPGKKISPHVNVAYQWNGDTVLAGDVTTGDKASLPDEFLYTIGAEIQLAPSFTLVFDLLGGQFVGAPRVFADTFTGPNGEQLPNIGFTEESFSVLSGAAGVKFNVRASLLVDFNVIFKLNSGGIRDKVTPLFGFEYTF